MLYLIAGHSLSDIGAQGIGKDPEAVHTRLLRNALLTKMNRKDVAIDDDRLDTRSVVSWLNRSVKRDDVVIDIHFNSFTNPEANGTETFPNQAAGKIGDKVHSIVVKTLGTRDRGIRLPQQSARGKIGILQLPCKVVLLEICFISNSSDMDKYRAGFDKLVYELSAYLETV